MGRGARKRTTARKLPPYAAVAGKIAAIEAEMKRIGLWQDEPLPAEAWEAPGAFGGNSMTYEQWLQFVLVPRTHQIIAERGQFPKRSHLGTMAVRNFDGMDDAAGLTELLVQLDRLVEC